MEGGRSQGGNDALTVVDTLGTTDGDAAHADGDPDGAEEPMSPRSADGPGDRGGAVATCVRGGTGNPEVRG